MHLSEKAKALLSKCKRDKKALQILQMLPWEQLLSEGYQEEIAQSYIAAARGNSTAGDDIINDTVTLDRLISNPRSRAVVIASGHIYSQETIQKLYDSFPYRDYLMCPLTREECYKINPSPCSGSKAAEFMIELPAIRKMLTQLTDTIDKKNTQKEAIISILENTISASNIAASIPRQQELSPLSEVNNFVTQHYYDLEKITFTGGKDKKGLF